MWIFRTRNVLICQFFPCPHIVLIFVIYFVSSGWMDSVYGITQFNSGSRKTDVDGDTEQRSGRLISSSKSCKCMEYWDCATRRGHPYSYCGISDTEVCCFIDENETKKRENKPPKTLLTPLSSLTTTISPPIALPQILNGNRSLRIKSQSRRRPQLTSARVSSFGECGKQKMDSNLDNVAQFMEWPWHVAILETVDDIYICGGSLISPNRVLTAAHCIASYVTKESKTRLKIRAGEYDVSTTSETLPHIEVLVNMVALHPQFNNATLENDIGILGLSRDVKFADNIQPVCLPGHLDRPKVSKVRRCVVTGWGRLNENTPHSVVLKEIVVPVWEAADCEARLRTTFGPNFKLPPTSVCAGDLKRDACDGDGGGPLVCWSKVGSKGKWIQEGIVSYGIGCGRRESPGIYTKVSWFINWIDAFLHSGVVSESIK